MIAPHTHTQLLVEKKKHPFFSGRESEKEREGFCFLGAEERASGRSIVVTHCVCAGAFGKRERERYAIHVDASCV